MKAHNTMTTLQTFLAKLKGDGAALPPQPSVKAAGLAWLGGFLAIAAVALIGTSTATLMVLGSFGASCVLVFGYPDAPFSQPRNVVVGHCVSSLIGLVFLAVFGAAWWAMAAAVGTAIAAMMLMRVVHPPAGSNPVIVFLGAGLSGTTAASTGINWGFMLFPTLLGALVVVLVALIYNNLVCEAKYPKYW